jgi:hypothetical protein
MRRQSQLVVRRLISVAAPIALLGLITQAVYAQTPQHTLIRNQSTSNPIEGGPGPSEGPPVTNSCSGVDPIKYPTSETVGQLNYILYNKCDAIKDLHLRFEVTKELKAEHDDEVSNCSASQVTQKLTTTDGIYIQFNAFSKDAPKALIQYIFAVTGKQITPHIQYAGGTPDNIDHDWQQDYANAYGLTLDKPNILPKGFILLLI